MKGRPIIMGGDSVRAILEGRKTQTRRVIKPQPHAGVRRSPFVPSGLEDGHGRELRCPYGIPSDSLYVRETWRHVVPWRPAGDRDIEDLEEWEYGITSWFYVWYKANNTCQGTLLPVRDCIDYDRRYLGDKWRPSIYMPKRLARIWLEAVSVWVERLQEISPDDIYAEGYPREMIGRTDPLLWFRDLWDSLNAKRGFGWSEDPWVWVVSFKVVP